MNIQNSETNRSVGEPPVILSEEHRSFHQWTETVSAIEIPDVGCLVITRSYRGVFPSLALSESSVFVPNVRIDGSRHPGSGLGLDAAVVGGAHPDHLAVR